jgi:hypothetical protein
VIVKPNSGKAFEALRAAYQATFDVDECLIKLVGNLTLRDVVLTPVERALLEVAIGGLSDARRELMAVNPNVYQA